jgi:hypothetical protein
MICSLVSYRVYLETRELNPRSSIYAQIPGFLNPMVKRCTGIFFLIRSRWPRGQLPFPQIILEDRPLPFLDSFLFIFFYVDP